MPGDMGVHVQTTFSCLSYYAISLIAPLQSVLTTLANVNQSMSLLWGTLQWLFLAR